MLSSSVTLLSGWLTLLTDDPAHLLKRWWFDLSGSTYELCFFETDQCQSLNLPPQGALQMGDVASCRVVDDARLDELVRERREASLTNARGSPGHVDSTHEYVRLMCDVERPRETEPIGLHLNSDYAITHFDEGSPSAIASADGGLQLGDRLLAIDGWEIEALDEVPYGRGSSSSSRSSRASLLFFGGTRAAAAKRREAKAKAVKDLLRDLDAFPKPIHTFTVERQVGAAAWQTLGAP